MAKKSKKIIASKPNDELKKPTVDLNQIGVVITRPKEQSELMIKQIERSNGTAFSVPCLIIDNPTDSETAKIECQEIANDADYWAFTSPNSVEYAQKFGLDFAQNKPCISIGSGTTKLLKQMVTSEIIQGDKPYTTEKLLNALESFSFDGQKISIFSGEGGRRLLENALNDMGADAHYVDVYRRVAAENIDLSEITTYSQSHPIVIMVSSQEAFSTFHDAAIQAIPNVTHSTLIVASERLEQFVKSLGYSTVYVADSAISQDLFNKLIEIAPNLTLTPEDTTQEDSFMTQPNDKDNPNIVEETPITLEEQPVVSQPASTLSEPIVPAAPKSNHSLSYIALALGILGIGVGAFAFLQTTQESTNTQNTKRVLETQIEQQKTQIDQLTQTLTNLKKSVDAERGQSTDFTNLADAQKQHQQTLQALQQRLTNLDASISNLQADNGTSVTRYNQLKEHLNEFEKIVTNLDQSINQIGKTANDVQNDAIKTQNRLTSQLVEINSKIASLSTLEARLSAATDIDLLNLTQAKYLLRLANFKLMFEDDTSEAIAILNDASERLMATANAKFSETNNLIQSEITKLKNIPTLNREEYAARIQNISDIIPSIDTKSDDILGGLKNTFHTEANKQDAETDDKPWYQKAVDKIKPVFVVTQERTPAPELLSMTDDSLLKQNIQLQLTTARLSLLQQEAQTYQESLKAARTLLINYFSPNDEQYHQVLAALNELLNINVKNEDLNITPILKSFDASMLNYRGEGL